MFEENMAYEEGRELRMRILCLIDNLGSGGAQRQLVYLGRELKKRGNAVDFFVYHAGGFFRPALDELGITVHQIDKRYPIDPSPLFHLCRLWNRSYDVALAFLKMPSLYAELANLVKVNHRIPLIVSERSTSIGNDSIIGRLIRQAHRFTTVVVANSDTQAMWLSRNFPFLRGRLQVIHNGVDLDEFRPNPNRTFMPTSHCRLLGIGRISRVKNIPNLVRALRICTQQHAVDVHVFWIGKVESKKEMELAMEVLRECQFGDRWTWLGERRDVAKLMNSSDALILPSLWEGLPNVVCEAMACGLPVLSSSVSDLSNMIEDGVQGFLLDPNDPQQMEQAIWRFASLNEHQRRAMGLSGRYFAEKELGLARFVDQYEQLMSSVVRTH
jgi:glycosyltransferase involved in cell wall biosynthesis